MMERITKKVSKKCPHNKTKAFCYDCGGSQSKYYSFIQNLLIMTI